MDKRFQVFVRHHVNGAVTATVLGFPHLTTFAASAAEARKDLRAVLGKLLLRDLDGITRAQTFWPQLETRRVDLVLQARQLQRWLPVPMRFTVLVRPNLGAGQEPRGAPLKGPVTVMIPRLNLEHDLDDIADLDVFVDEFVRHELFMASFSRIRAVAYEGPETVETIQVSVKPPAPRMAREENRVRDRRLPEALPPGLAEATRRLGDLAAAGMIDRASQREGELAQLIELFTLSRRASVLLVGRTGVGKTALVHELTHRVLAAEPASPLAGLEIYTTSGARIVAGMRYLGEWQARLGRIVTSLRARKAVLHLENLGEFLAAFGDEGGLDGASFLLPAITAGEITVLLEATPDELARAERRHAPFVQALRALVVHPLDRAEAWLALSAAAQRISRGRGLRFAPEALREAGELSERFGESLPGAALALLRAAAAEVETGRNRTLTATEVTAAFCRRTGYPAELIDPTIPLDPDAVFEGLRARVVGQDEALRLLRDLIVTLKAAMGDRAKPLGSFLLLGPTGVGKTESALALAHYLFGNTDRLVRFDMSEYADAGSALRLVGLYGSDGTLARKVREQPFGVLLFDEIEKADPSVHNLLLQALDEGRITDATGHTVDLRNTIVVLTSNLGADTAARVVGFQPATPGASQEAHYRAAAAAFFRPELLNRIDHLVPYRPLAPEAIHAIAARLLDEALRREGVVRRGVTVRYAPEVLEVLATIGMDPRYGARPLKRAIERLVVGPLAAILARAETPAPQEIWVRTRGTEVVVECTAAHRSPAEG